MTIAANREAVKYDPSEMRARIRWMLVQPLFRLSPRPMFRWRSALLRRFGAQVGPDVHIYNSAKIYFPWNLVVGEWSAIGEGTLIYNLGPISIGAAVTVSHRVHLCAGTHDYTDPSMPLLKPPITVQNRVWICADAFLGPNVTVGEGAVVGARAVVTKDVPPWIVVAGNPARAVKERVLKREGGRG